MKRAMAGLLAGAAGTVALNVTTYLDMAVRGRPSSQVPARVVEEMANRAGIELGGEEMDERSLQNRLSGLGALSGYLVGLTTGMVYGLMNANGRQTSMLRSGVGLSAAAMAGSDIPATATGVTDPRNWSRSAWLADIIPHLAYGLVAAAVFKALSSGRE